MQVLYPHCAGLDVHKDTVVACVRHMIGGTVKREVRTFDTTTKGLLALADWLASEGARMWPWKPPGPIGSPPAYGAPWLKTTLIQCSCAAVRKKASYFQAQFHRIRSRRGGKKAVGAVAASILTAVYHMLKDGTAYHDLGPDHFDGRAKTTQTKRLVTRLQNLGYEVQITPLAA